MSDPLVSIVVCTYNRGEYLDRCIQSLRRQSYQNIEIIIVDGPSVDETEAVLKKYDRLVIIKQPQLNGISNARNLGIRAAKGDVVAFIDDDAMADENWVLHLAEGYSDQNVAGVGGLVYGPGQTHRQFDNGVINKCGIPDAIRPSDKEIEDDEFPIFMGTNCSFRRSALIEVGGFDPYFRYYHDESELCVRIVKAGRRLMYKRDAYVIHDMAEGHNRKSPYDLNWSEIAKNVIYFTMKDFGDEFRSYTTRPMASSYLWLKQVYLDYKGNRISFSDLGRIEYKIVRGVFSGYLDGLKYNIYKKNKVNFVASIPDNCSLFYSSSQQDGPRLKIAYISQEFVEDCGGGDCFYTRNLARGFAKLGHEVHVIAISERSCPYDYMDGEIYVHKINPKFVDFLGLSDEMSVSKKNIAFSYAAAEKVLELKERFGIQIVEAPLWDAQGFVTALIKPVPVVIRLITPLSKFLEIQGFQITRDFKLANWLEGETVRRATKNIAISRNIGSLIAGHHRIDENTLSYSVLGIDLPNEDKLRRSSSKDAYEILFVGRLERRKGIDTLFRAIPSIIDAEPSARFTIVGRDTNLAPDGGSYKRHLLDTLDKKYHKYITFTGFVPSAALRDHYRDCDLLAAPSLYESFGQIYIEAMAWGKPVIGCKAGGIPEVISNGETGFVIAPDDDHELSDKIIALNDDALRYKMGCAAREFAKSNFKIEKMVDDTFKIYIEILKSQNLNIDILPIGGNKLARDGLV